MRTLRPLLAGLIWALSALAAPAQDADAPIQALLAEHREIIERSSRRTIGPAIDALAASGMPAARAVLERWAAREMYLREADGLFVFAEEAGEDDAGEDLLRLFDPATGEEIGVAREDGFDQLRPNSGIRALIGSALVTFRLGDADPAERPSTRSSARPMRRICRRCAPRCRRWRTPTTAPGPGGWSGF